MSTKRILLIVLSLLVSAGMALLATRLPRSGQARPPQATSAIPPRAVGAQSVPPAPASSAATRATAGDAKPSAQDPEFKAMVAALGAPLPPDDTAVADLFEPLLASARRGDTRASCRLSRELQRCAMARVSEQTAANVEGEIARREQTPDSAVNYVARLQDGAQRESRGCAGLSDAQLGHAFDLQLQTALRVPATRLWFALNPALDPWNFVNDLERWMQYRQHAMPWLEEAAAQGDPAALIALARVHGDLRRIGPPFPRFRIADAEKFLVYAELMARQGIRFAPVTRDVEQLRARLDADTLQRVADRVAALHRPERASLSKQQVGEALQASLRRVPTTADCARAE